MPPYYIGVSSPWLSALTCFCVEEHGKIPHLKNCSLWGKRWGSWERRTCWRTTWSTASATAWSPTWRSSVSRFASERSTLITATYHCLLRFYQNTISFFFYPFLHCSRRSSTTAWSPRLVRSPLQRPALRCAGEAEACLWRSAGISCSSCRVWRAIFLCLRSLTPRSSRASTLHSSIRWDWVMYNILTLTLIHVLIDCSIS